MQVAGIGHDMRLASAARGLADIDRRRRGYIEQLRADAGIPPQRAATRAQVLYWTYLGAALSRSRLTGERLDRSDRG